METDRIEKFQAFLLQYGADPAGEDFFAALARYLSHSLGMEFICIDRLAGDNLSARTVAVYHDGRFEDNVSYTLRDTPCGAVVGNAVCAYPHGVCQLFPRDEVLRELCAESYIGVTLWSSAGRPIGLIALIGRKPLSEPRPIETLLKLVALRAAHELERRIATEELAESERQFRSMFELASIGMAQADPSTGRLLRVNPKMCAITGYDADELLRLTISEITHPADRQRDAELFQRAVRGETHEYKIEKRYLRKNGEIVWVNVNLTVIRDDAGQTHHTMATIEDITEIHRARARHGLTVELLRLLNQSLDLHELMRRITLLLREWSDCAAVGIRLREGDDFPYFETQGFPPRFVELENTICQRGPDGQPVRDGQGNPVLECMCGNVLSGRFNPALPFFTPRGSFWTRSTSKLLAATSERDRQGVTRNRCHGEGYESVALVPLRFAGATLGLLQFNDPAESRFTLEHILFLEECADQIAIAFAQRRAYGEMRERERQLRLLADHTPVAIAQVDAALRYRFVNQTYAETFGLRREEILSRPVADVLPPNILALARPHMDAALAGQRQQFDLATDACEAPARTMHVTYSPEFDGAGRVVGFVAAVTDITERRRMEEEQARLQAQLAQSQKMESVGRLAGGVAHDFNNMLGVILGHGELAMEQLDPLSPLYDDLLEIQKAAQRSADLTRQLLAFARRQPVAPKVIDLNGIVAGALKMLERLIGENIELEWKPGANLWPVKMDPTQVDQILANLSVNARDAITGTGRLSIATRNVSPDEIGRLGQPAFVPGPYVLLSVGDTGSGMDEATVSHLFEPFFTTKEVGRGTGLGLATIYGIVNQNHGFITVASTPGRGTTFDIYFPRTQPEAPPAAAREKRPAQGTETVLLAEDEAAILKLGTKILERYGYTVLAARTPDEALGLAETHPGPIHLLITDVVMPEMNGKELRNRIAALRPGIKAIFISGYTADVIAHHGVLDAGLEFLQKPFSGSQFAEKVHAVLSH